MVSILSWLTPVFPRTPQRTFWLRLSVTVALTALGAGLVWGDASDPVAEDPGKPGASEAEGEEAASGPDEKSPSDVGLTERIVVTATRLQTPRDQIGSTVTVITAEELDRQQYRLGADALGQVPGVDVRRSGGPGTNTSIFIRGSNADHTMVLLDGIELNDPSAPSHGPLIDHLTLDSVERIEILRGPQSTLYGSDAMGGVVHFITKRGAGEPRGNFSADGGSFSTLGARFNVSGGDDRLDYTVAASHTDSGGFTATSAGTEPDPYRNTTLAARVGVGLGPSRDLDIHVRHVDSRVDFDGFEAEENHFVDATQSMVKIEPRFSMFGGRWSHRLGVRLARHQRDTTGSFPTRAKGNLAVLDWQNNLKLTSGHVLTLGVDTSWEQARFPTYDDQAHTLSFYAQDQFTAGTKFSGTVGLRLDDHSEFGSEMTFRIAGARRLPRSGTVVRASYGTGFKAPALSQLNPLAYGGNPDLKAETSRGFDVGWERASKSRRSVVGATYFENRMDDLIVAVFDPMTSSFQNINVDQAEARGVEFHVHLRPEASVSLRGSYTYTDSEATGSPQTFGLQEGSSLLRRPRHKGSVDVGYRFFQEKANVMVSTSYVGTRDDIDPVSFSVREADDHVLVNLTGSVDVSRGVRLFGRIDNLLDEDYEEILGFETAGLSGYAGVRFAF